MATLSAYIHDAVSVSGSTQNTDFEETFSLKEWALFLDPRINKNGDPRRYHTARRLLLKFGGYRVINDNPDYKILVVTRRRAEEILAAITTAKRGRK